VGKLEFKDIFSVLNDYDVFLFDLWGVIVEGGSTYPGVVDNINKILEQKKVFFVSNAPRCNISSNEVIRAWGINVSPEMVVTSGEVARQAIIASESRLGIKNPVIYHLGADRNDYIINDLGYPTTTNIKEANILLLTIYRDEDENLEEFDELFKAVVKQDTIIICANPDIIAPNHGVTRYCAGYFAAKIERFGGKVLYTGKPHSEIYYQVLNQLQNIPKNRILMIGDTFETDILGANRAGIDSALVLTGNAKKFHIEYSDMGEKLAQLKNAANNVQTKPSFVIKVD
jgi:HAD superfamily hydrolase (TIGR01459 family)